MPDQEHTHDNTDFTGSGTCGGVVPHVELYKAVQVIGGEYYALGMGPAEAVHLPSGEWLDGGEHGFMCTKTRGAARDILYQIRRRKVMPIPDEMVIIRVLGKVRYEKSSGPVICDEIKLH